MDATHHRHTAADGLPASSRFNAAAAAISLLVGLTMGWLIVALRTRLGLMFGDVPHRDTVVLASCFGALALGVRLPHRLAIGLASLAWKRRDASPVDDILTTPDRDRPLLWAVMAAVVMAAGLSVATMGVAARFVAWVYGFAARHFFWTPPTDTVLVALLGAAFVLIPLALAGVVLTCLNQLDDVDRRGALPHAPWLLFGATAGLFAVHPLIARHVQPDLPVVLSALPLLLAAMLSVQQTKQAATTAPPSDGFPFSNLARNIALIRCTTAISAAASAGLILLWSRLMPTWTGGGLSTHETVGCLLASAAAGALSASPRWVPDVDPAMTLARSTSTAGVVTIAAAASSALLIGRSAGATPVVWMLPACLSVLLAARVQSLAYRSAHAGALPPGAAAASLLSECLLAPAIVLGVVAALAPTTAECLVLLATIGLALAAVGASMILQESGRSLGGRVTRACALLTVAIGMAAAFPRPAEPPDRSATGPAHHEQPGMAIAETPTSD